ncbi:MAG: decaprenyl-phosphate phosphoribosyltransferase [Candidatus Eisenbacteria bacterium]|nr:decaprenyl-phosphate phosphoribosyltransferase [Candidatus Eisenbacteria bacterium]
MLAAIVRAMRPEQWTKNLVLFAGLLFAGGLTDPVLLGLSVQGFLAFCLLSGASYLMNDLVDLRRDREHPEKRRRPLASGAVSPRAAGLAALIAAVAGLAWSYAVNPGFGHVALGYVALNAAYSLVLRRVVILDVMAIAVGFVLRAVGSVEVLVGDVSRIELSPWLLVCTFLLALFLGLGKRRHEVVALGSGAGAHREALEGYPRGLVEALISATGSATIVSYAIYTIWPGTVEKIGSARLVYTIPFVVYGVLRYMYLILAAGQGGAPARSLVSDRPLGLNILLWVVAVAITIYLR